MSVIVNTFPPFQSMSSSRVWALAIIAVLHLLLFWALSSGLSNRIVAGLKAPPVQVVDVPIEKIAPPVDRREPTDVQPLSFPEIAVPRPDDLIETETSDSTVVGSTRSDPMPGSTEHSQNVPAPVVQQPVIDPRLPLSEPQYPPAEIRLGHTGTVLLNVQVLENGRVGDVRIQQSSGFPRLDAAAEREARRWRLKPGTNDGRPVAMWKTIPITFQLKR